MDVMTHCIIDIMHFINDNIRARCVYQNVAFFLVIYVKKCILLQVNSKNSNERNFPIRMKKYFMLYFIHFTNNTKIKKAFDFE